MPKQLRLLILGVFFFILGLSQIKWLNLTIFFAFVPFLIFLDKNPSTKKWRLLFLAILISNLVSLTWLKEAITLLQYFLLCFFFSVFTLLPFLTKKINQNEVLFSVFFVSAWLSLEYFFLNSIVAFPMSILGLSLGHYPELIQWWEYTGLDGGTLWILIVNISIYLYFKKKYVFLFPIITFFPIIISFSIFLSKEKKQKSTTKLCIIRTNLPCKNVKYNKNSSEITSELIDKTKQIITKNDSSNYAIIWPETALTRPKNINNLEDSDFTKILKNGLLDRNIILTGSFLKDFELKNKYGILNKGAMFNSGGSGGIANEKYFAYNSILAISSNNNWYRIKEKLVPFNEYLPFFEKEFFLSKFLYTGPFFFSKYKNIENVTYQELVIAPLICYESFFGNFVRKFVSKGANAISVSVNEGWYNSKKGFQLIHSHAIARAIENRISVVKSSNCGISAYIDERGITQMHDKISNGFQTKINISNKETFFQKYGDYIAKISMLICGIFLFSQLKDHCSKFITKKNQN